MSLFVADSMSVLCFGIVQELYCTKCSVDLLLIEEHLCMLSQLYLIGKMINTIRQKTLFLDEIEDIKRSNCELILYMESSIEPDKMQKRKKKAGKKGNVKFMLDKDRQPWTWVMGEHKNDRSIEQIMEDEAKDKARKLADIEAMELQEKEEREAQKNIREVEQNIVEEIRRKEEDNKKKAEEAAIYQSLKEARLLQQKLNEEKKKEEEESKKKLRDIKKQHELRKRSSIIELEQNKQKRTSELYNSFKLERRRISVLAEQQSIEMDEEWVKQEERVKKVDRERRETARRAREDYKGSLRETIKMQSQMIGMAMAGYKKAQSKRLQKENQPPPQQRKQKIRPAKPPNRAAIVEWFKELERPRGAGLDPKTEQLADWFHGIISRQEAEDLLDAKPVGSFLVRVSERIWGYAISYKNFNRSQHFLIDTADGSYQFFGTNQIKHPSLADLVTYHRSRAITSSGDELLRHACRQTKQPPDCHELFEDCDAESTSL